MFSVCLLNTLIIQARIGLVCKYQIYFQMCIDWHMLAKVFICAPLSCERQLWRQLNGGAQQME